MKCGEIGVKCGEIGVKLGEIGWNWVELCKKRGEIWVEKRIKYTTRDIKDCLGV